MAIRFPCPECGKTLKVGDDLAGRRIACPSCGAKAEVPDPSQLEIQPLDDEAEAPAPPAPGEKGSARRRGPVDMGEARRESRRASKRDRRREADINPGKVRLNAEQRREARQGMKEIKKNTRESRRGTPRPGRARPGRDAVREARTEMAESDRRRRDSARQVRGKGSGRRGGPPAPIPRLEPKKRESSRRSAPTGPAAGPTVGGPIAPTAVTPPFCPACRAATIPGAKVCTVCGLNFSTGTHLKTKRPLNIPWKSIMGPVLFVVLCGAVWLYVVKPLLNKGETGDPAPTQGGTQTPAPVPVATGTEPAPSTGTGGETETAGGPESGEGGEGGETATEPEPDPYSAAVFTGGRIRESVMLEDKSAPYVLKKAIVVDGGGTLRIAPGVRLEGKELTLARGTLHIAGTDAEPVYLNVILNNRRGGAEEFLVENCYFQKIVSVNSCKKFIANKCTFEESVHLQPARIPGVEQAVYRITNSELKDREIALQLRASQSGDRLQLRISRCNIFGPVSYWIEMFAKAEVVDCFFPNGAKMIPSRTEGDFIDEPRAAALLQGIGAGTKATGAAADAGGGSIWAKEVTTGDADRRATASNDKLGFTIEHPGDWRTANRGEMIRGPAVLSSPSVEVRLAPGGASAIRAVDAIIQEIKGKGAMALKTSPMMKSQHPAGECWERIVDYDIAGSRWRKKFTTVSAGGKTYIVIGTFKKDKEFEAGSAVTTIMGSFNPK